MKIGIDLGGTKTEGVLIDNKNVIDRIRNKTPKKNYRDLLLNIISFDLFKIIIRSGI